MMHDRPPLPQPRGSICPPFSPRLRYPPPSCILPLISLRFADASLPASQLMGFDLCSISLPVSEFCQFWMPHLLQRPGSLSGFQTTPFLDDPDLHFTGACRQRPSFKSLTSADKPCIRCRSTDHAVVVLHKGSGHDLSQQISSCFSNCFLSEVIAEQYLIATCHCP